jgi:hypothetical protein
MIFILGFCILLRALYQGSFETSVRMRTTRRYIPEEGNVHLTALFPFISLHEQQTAKVQAVFLYSFTYTFWPG